MASQQIRPELVAGRWSLAPLDQATDELGRRVDTLSVPTTPAGYQDLLAWAAGSASPSPGAWMAPASYSAVTGEAWDVPRIEWECRPGRSQRLVACGSSMWAVFYAPTPRAA